MSVDIYEMEQPDTLFWAVWNIQQYAKYSSRSICYNKYGQLLKDIMNYIWSGKHPNLFIHDNGLVYSNGRDHAITWMNSFQKTDVPSFRVRDTLLSSTLYGITHLNSLNRFFLKTKEKTMPFSTQKATEYAEKVAESFRKKSPLTNMAICSTM